MTGHAAAGNKGTFLCVSSPTRNGEQFLATLLDVECG